MRTKELVSELDAAAVDGEVVEAKAGLLKSVALPSPSQPPLDWVPCGDFLVVQELKRRAQGIHLVQHPTDSLLFCPAWCVLMNSF